MGGSDKGRAYLEIPFDPGEVWGEREKHYVVGTINGGRVRAVIERSARGFFMPLGPAFRRSRGLRVGDEVEVTLAAEGPQRDALAPDIAAALAAAPDAARLFDSMAQWYRKNFLTWIDATKKRPDVRAERIAEMVRLLESGRKERPR
jgi:uncharacterized protein with von Willebrand factor type A (vWA) domain